MPRPRYIRRYRDGLVKKVNCEYWSDRNVVGGGVCTQGRYGGRPSLGTCDFCQGKPPRAPDPALAKFFTVQVKVTDRRATEGPKRWAALHRRALAWDPATGDFKAEVAFIATLADGLGMCSCKKDWAEFIERVPPDLWTTADAYFAWTVTAHNEVNVKLRKPIVTVEEARRLAA